jgi:hypothetical protein
MSATDHQAFMRVVSGQTIGPDRQWMRLLSDILEDVSIDTLMRAGMAQDTARDLLTLCALTARDTDQVAA